MELRRLAVIELAYGVPLRSSCNRCGRIFRVLEAEAIANPRLARENLAEEFESHSCAGNGALTPRRPTLMC
jgi:hypothetical protein